ncbi:MAG: hypothetical protein ABJE47_08150 [bacterium]
MTPTDTDSTGKPAFGMPALMKVGSILLQLALAALVIRQFELENRTFFNVFLLSAVAFPVHALLPARYRLSFFAAVSLGGIFLVFGPLGGGLLIGAGLALIGVCHLPLAFGVRVAIALAIGGVLALARDGRIPSVMPAGVWPILGSMFMFRLAVYMQALKHDKTPPTIARTLSYFFMLPNVCFPLYPVVDYTTFGRTYYDDDADAIYQRGAKWITRGLVHLLLYRYVYLHLTLDPTTLHSLSDLVQALLSVFLLYLRVSGQFHLIVGLLQLFGFHLPETHRLYYLASSISDYWRRINIYWKDFMMKLVFYPSFFKLRGKGDRVALVLSTLCVFFATWLLHSYQWFWLRSEFPITPQDILFWALLGGLVVINTLRETKKGRKRTLAAKPKGWDSSLALRTTGTFILLCILWSLWSAESLVDWLFMWPAALHVGAMDVAVVGGLLAFGLAVSGFVWDAPVSARKGPEPLYLRTDVRTYAVLVALLVISTSQLKQAAGPRIGGFIATLQSASLNTQDRALQQRGYYEKLDNRGRLSAQLWTTIQRAPAGLLALTDTKAYRRRTDDFIGGDLTPNSSGLVSGKLVTVNSMGMRDHDYTLAKPADTKRIALLGPSYTMGSGVADDETYDAYLEPRMNEQQGGSPRYETLNFGVAAYSLLHQMRILDDRAYKFNPDVVLLTDSRTPARPIVQHLIRALEDGTLGTYPGLDSIVKRAGVHDYPGKGVAIATDPLRAMARMVGVKTRMPYREAYIRLNNAMSEIIDWTLQHTAEQAKAHGAVPIFVDGMFPADTAIPDSPMMASARKHGFLVIELATQWEGQPRDDLRIGAWDNHPNPRAMKMIADGLYREFQKHESELHLGIHPASTATPPPTTPDSSRAHSKD